MKILITGGAGFIGSHLALKLVSLGHKVRILDNLSSQIHGEFSKTSSLYLKIKDHVEFLLGDVRDQNTWPMALKGMNAVIHLAAETGTGQSMYEIGQYAKTNVEGTAHMLEALASGQYPVSRLLVSSTRAVYGEGKYHCKKHGEVFPQGRTSQNLLKGDFHCKCPLCGNTVVHLPTDEQSMIHPISVYGVTKYAQEQMALSIGASLGIKVTALRYQNVYGPGQSLVNPYTGILSIFSNRAQNGNDILVFEDGNETRDFVYIDDVVEATTLAVLSQSEQQDIINVGTGQGIKVRDVAYTIANHFSSNGSRVIINKKFRLGDIRHNMADVHKLNSLLEFKTKVSFEVGIRNFLNWVENQKKPQDHFEDSLEELKRKGLYR